MNAMARADLSISVMLPSSTVSPKSRVNGVTALFASGLHAKVSTSRISAAKVTFSSIMVSLSFQIVSLKAVPNSVM